MPSWYETFIGAVVAALLAYGATNCKLPMDLESMDHYKADRDVAIEQLRGGGDW